MEILQDNRVFSAHGAVKDYMPLTVLEGTPPGAEATGPSSYVVIWISRLRPRLSPPGSEAARRLFRLEEYI